MEQLYKEMFDEVHASDRLRQEVMNMTKQERKSIRKKISRTTLIAAAVAVLLAGTAVAVSAETGMIWRLGDAIIQISSGPKEPVQEETTEPQKPRPTQPVPEETLPDAKPETRPDRVAPDTLQGWHEAAWKKQTQQETMPESQKKIIDSLTVPVGVSDTCNGVTATVDSVTVGDNRLWVLLKFDQGFGLEQELPRNLFGTFDMHFYDSTGEELETTMRGYEGSFSNLDSQGRLTTELMIKTNFVDPAVSLRNGCTVEISVMDLMAGDLLIQDGNWTLRFDLAPVEQEQPVLTVDSAEVAYLYIPLNSEKASVTVLPDGTEVRHCDDSDNEERFITLRNIRVSDDAIRFTAVGDTDSYTPNLGAIILADGTEIRASGPANTTNFSEEGVEWVSYWKFPVDLSQVVALRFTEEGSGSSVPVRDTIVPLK